MRFQELTDRMGDDERETLNGILQRTGAQDLGKLRLRRVMKRRDYAYVLD
jgi:hypothetical protein